MAVLLFNVANLSCLLEGYLKPVGGMFRCRAVPTWRCTGTSLHTGAWRADPDYSWSSALNTGCAAPSWSSAAVRGKPLHTERERGGKTNLDTEWQWTDSLSKSNSLGIRGCGLSFFVIKVQMTYFFVSAQYFCIGLRQNIGRMNKPLKIAFILSLDWNVINQLQ